MKKPKTAKTKAVEAVKYWGYEASLFKSKELATLESLPWKPDTYYVLPADDASVERMMEQMALAAYRCNRPDRKSLPIAGILADAYRCEARAALASIGVKGGAK